MDKDLKDRFGIESAHFEDELTVRMPTAEQTRMLRLPPGTPTINLLRTYYDKDGRRFGRPFRADRRPASPRVHRTRHRGDLSMTALAPDLDLPGMLETVRTRGAAFTDDTTLHPALDELRAEARKAPFEPLPAQKGQVRTEAELFLIPTESPDYPTVESLRSELTRLLMPRLVAR